jgi:hypothetical protein
MREMVETYKEGNIGIKLDLFYGPSMSQPMISLGSKRLSDVINTNIHYIKPAVCLLCVCVSIERERENSLLLFFSLSSCSDDNFLLVFLQSPPLAGI